MSVSMTMNGAVLPVLAMYIVAAEEQVRNVWLFPHSIWLDVVTKKNSATACSKRQTSLSLGLTAAQISEKLLYLK